MPLPDAHLALDGVTAETATSDIYTPRRAGAGDPWQVWAPVHIDHTEAVTLVVEGQALAGMGWGVLHTEALTGSGSKILSVLMMPRTRFRLESNVGTTSVATVATEKTT